MVISYLLPFLLSALLGDTRELGLVGCLGMGREIFKPIFPREGLNINFKFTLYFKALFLSHLFPEAFFHCSALYYTKLEGVMPSCKASPHYKEWWPSWLFFPAHHRIRVWKPFFPVTWMIFTCIFNLSVIYFLKVTLFSPFTLCDVKLGTTSLLPLG